MFFLHSLFSFFSSLCFPVVISPCANSRLTFDAFALFLLYMPLLFCDTFYNPFNSTHNTDCLFCARYFPELQGYRGEQDPGITTKEYIGWQERQARQQVIAVVGAKCAFKLVCRG